MSKPRTWGKKGFLPFRLEVLAPIFIGSGEAVSPLEYVLRERDDGHFLCRIDLQDWLAANAADSSVSGVIDSGDIVRIRRLLAEKVDAELYGIAFCPISRDLADTLRRSYEGQSEGQRGDNKGKTGDVDAAMRNPANGAPYIPGSSLKGAISTPLMDELDRNYSGSGASLKDCWKKEQEKGMKRWQDTMFGRIGEHSMQALKVSDVFASFSSCSVVRAAEMNQTPGKQGTPKNPCEAIMPGTGSLWGRFMMDAPEGKPCITLQKIQRKICLPDLIRICNKFYGDRFRKEYEKFYRLPHFKSARETVEAIKKKIDALDDNTMLLRVGHYSHVESVTVSRNEPKTRPGKNGQHFPSGTTRTLADGKSPFGWVLLHFCTPEEYERGMKEFEAQYGQFMQKQAERRRDIEENARQLVLNAQKKRQLQQEREQKAAEEQRKKEELKQRMSECSPEEALLLQLESDSSASSEPVASEIYQKMQSWDSGMQKRAAETLKAYWMKIDKWNGRQSKRQAEKIKAIKSILGA
ncbi:MAG: RAMP superfamily CRISPR-associated protein [Desulfovibrionaceae bacterium]|nr:RAMP superfamily CRISPR-associated protein [Desulfovibrionaceae bacterium]